jgi:hypothetical protein
MSAEWRRKYQKAYKKLARYFVHKYKLQPVKLYEHIYTYAASINDQYIEIMIIEDYFYFTIDQKVKAQEEAAKLMLKFMGYDN